MGHVHGHDQESLTFWTSHLVGNPVLLQWATTEHKDDGGYGGYGALMGKDLDEDCELLEEMTSNDF